MVSAHQRTVANFEPGRQALATINAKARSACRHAGPNRSAKPTLRAIAATAATCPCGRDRWIVNNSSAPTKHSPRNDRRNNSTVAAGRQEMFATVSFLTLPASR